MNGEHNPADLLTKGVPQEVLKRHIRAAHVQVGGGKGCGDALHLVATVLELGVGGWFEALFVMSCVLDEIVDSNLVDPSILDFAFSVIDTEVLDVASSVLARGPSSPGGLSAPQVARRTARAPPPHQAAWGRFLASALCSAAWAPLRGRLPWGPGNLTGPRVAPRPSR